MPEIKDGFMYYESDFLGKVSVVKDSEDQITTPQDPNKPTPDAGGSTEEDVKKNNSRCKR